MTILPEHARRRGHPSQLVVGSLLAIGSTALVGFTVVGAELLARLREPDYLTKRRGLHVFSETYGWRGRPGASVVIEGKRVTLNGSGYRGRELALPRASGRTRVVVLGDSIAFGLHVADEETFAHLLDVRDNGIEAGNLAVQGYGPDQELLVLARDGLRYEPDVVVLAFCLANDFAEAVLPVSLYDGRTPKPRFRLAGDRLVLDDSSLRRSAARRVHQWLSDYSHLFNRALAPDRDGMPRGSGWHERHAGAVRDGDYALRLSIALVREMDTVCHRRGITFLVAVFPDRDSYRMNRWLADDFVGALRSAGVAVVDMGVRFRAISPRLRTFAFDRIGHLNPAGHSVASAILESEIASRVKQTPRPLLINNLAQR